MNKRLFELGYDPEPTTGTSTTTEAVPLGPLRRVMLLVAYDGTAFRGFARQPGDGVDTVGGALEAALGRMTREEVSVTCAGRTDAGVHARGQVVHADLPTAVVERWLSAEPGDEPAELPRLAKSLTSQCGPALSVARARLAPVGFDARRSALARRYRYQIQNDPVRDPIARHSSWHVPGELDLSAMRIAADSLLGEHDFAAFCRRPPGLHGPLTRRVSEVRWEKERSLLSLEIEANAFCHRMVRSIVGCLVAVGQGRLSAAEVFDILRSADRARSADPAPPEGLVLLLVRYPPEMVEGGVFAPLEL